MRKLANSIGTVDKLERALLSCLNEKEYCNVTISAISRRAGINRTTFYLFFGSKDELFVHLCGSIIDQWFQRFFDLNITRNVESEKELYYQLLTWIRQWRPALKQIPDVKTDSFDGFSLLREEIELKMSAQKPFQTEDRGKRKKYDLFIKVYSFGVVYILKWMLDEEDDFDAAEFHSMLQCLRYKCFYSVLDC